MNKKIPQDWLYPESIEKAQQVQKFLAESTVKEDKFTLVDFIGGMDVSNNLYDPQSKVYASAVILDNSTLSLRAEATEAQIQTFPYIPGFLGFREAPALIAAFNKLKYTPQLILIDGHGISHPRGLGIASHLGVLLDIPTIGVAKSILVGRPASSLGELPGDRVPLMWKGEQIALMVRTKKNCNPLIISTGHRVSLETAANIVLKCLKGYKLPEPTRQAHLAANRCRLYYKEKDLLSL